MPSWTTRLRAALALLTLGLGCGGDPVSTGLTTALIAVDGRTVETQRGGPASATGPAVVFEAGEGDDLGVWNHLAPLVAKTSRVFLYSRAGYGRSSAGQNPRDGATLVDELRSVLRVAQVKPPIVLVAHSDAGLYAELFAKTHGDELAGLVLIEPRHRDFDSQCQAQNIPECDIPSAEVSQLPEPFQSEFKGLPATITALRGLGNFGALPLRVITGSGIRPENNAWLKLWSSLHQKLAAESARGQQVFAVSGHVVQVEQPEVVVTAIADVLAAR